MFDWIKHLFTGLFGGGVGGAVATKIVERMGERVGDVLVTRTAKVIEEDPRREVVDAIFLRLKEANPDAAKVMIDRLKKAAKEADPDLENNVVRSLGRLLPRDDKGNIDTTNAEKVFAKVAELDDTEFGVMVETMKHDPIVQYVRSIVGRDGKNLKEFFAKAAKLGEVFGIAIGAFCGVVSAAGSGLAEVAERASVKLEGSAAVPKLGQVRDRMKAWALAPRGEEDCNG